MLRIVDELVEKKKFAKLIITKSVLETSCGIKIWEALRTLSDYCIQEELTRACSKNELKVLPTFI